MISKILKMILILSLVLFCTYKLFFWFDAKTESSEIKTHFNTVRIPIEKINQLQTGDVILRRGFGLVSDLVSEMQQTEYDLTHCGFIIKAKDNYFVVHSLSSDVAEKDGVQIETLYSFLQSSQPQKIVITRIKNRSEGFEVKFQKKILALLQQKVPFDRNGNFDDASELFCSELIINIFKDLKLLELPKEAKSRKDFYYKLNTLYDSKYFEKVYTTFK